MLVSPHQFGHSNSDYTHVDHDKWKSILLSQCITSILPVWPLCSWAHRSANITYTWFLKFLHSPPLFLSNLSLASLSTGQVWTHVLRMIIKTIPWESESQWRAHKRQNIPDATYPFLPVNDQIQVALGPLSSVTHLWTLVINFPLI
jgi:hypothetical protein